MSISYKILFEVKLLHEFYLTSREGKSIFEINNQADRLEFLTGRYLSEFRGIESEVSFGLQEDTRSMFKNYGLRLIKSYAGFKIAIEVNEKSLPAGVTGYEPRIPITAGLNIPVLLVKNNDLLNSFTNNRMRKQLSSYYYFSNDSVISGGKVFPSLSGEAPVFDPAYDYEQGEIVKFGNNDYREFYLDDADNVQWINCNSGGIANENDRLLLPTVFNYSFPDEANVTDSDILLKDKNGIVVSEYHFSDDLPLEKLSLNVDPAKIKLLPASEVNDTLLYTIEVTGNNGYNKTYKVVFFDNEQSLKNSMGIVVINSAPADPQYNVFDNAGLLLTKKLADGSYNPSHPVFEIRLKSRLSFWRYVNNGSKDLQNGLHPDFLITKSGKLVTKIPRPLTYSSTLFRKPDNSLYYLPNPEPYNTIRIENNKMYSEIMVPESALFPLAP